MKRTFSTLFALVAAILTIAVPAVTLAQLTPAATGLNRAAQGTGLTTSCTGADCVATVIANIITIVLGFLGVVLLLIVMYAGFKWMTAEKEDDTKNAKSMIKNAVIGMAIIALSYAISSFVIDQLTTISNPPSNAPTNPGGQVPS